MEFHMELFNLTPHAINIMCIDGAPLVSLSPSGTIARVDVVRTRVSDLLGGLPVFRTTFGELVGLPDPVDGRIYVCSLIAAQAAISIGRTDVLSPGELVRDEAGRPIGCLGLTDPR